MFKKHKSVTFPSFKQKKSHKKKLVGLGLGSAVLALFAGIVKDKERHQ